MKVPSTNNQTEQSEAVLIYEKLEDNLIVERAIRQTCDSVITTLLRLKSIPMNSEVRNELEKRIRIWRHIRNKTYYGNTN
jgi:hypothetical protein